jgi:hypothetical protein
MLWDKDYLLHAGGDTVINELHSLLDRVPSVCVDMCMRMWVPVHMLVRLFGMRTIRNMQILSVRSVGIPSMSSIYSMSSMPSMSSIYVRSVRMSRINSSIDACHTVHSTQIALNRASGPVAAQRKLILLLILVLLLIHACMRNVVFSGGILGGAS